MEKEGKSQNKLVPKTKLDQNLIKLVHVKKNFFNGVGRQREES